MIKKWYSLYIQTVDKLCDKIKNKLIKNNHTQLYKTIIKIQPEQFKNFNNQNNSLILIPSQYPNIELYCNKLKEAIYFLSNNKLIYNQWSVDELKQIKITQFLLSSQSFYIDEELILIEFKKLALEYICIYESLTKYEIGIEAHNIRILLLFTRCLEQTANTIISLQKS